LNLTPSTVTFAEKHTRTPFDSCPLCGGEFGALKTVSCVQHPLWRAGLPLTQSWCRCADCAHVFTAGYFTGDAESFLFQVAHPQQLATAELERSRHISAELVERISRIRNGCSGTWVDIGCGNGSLVATAQEFGFDALGIDARQQAVAALTSVGVKAQLGRGTDSLERFDVLSMCDVLEHMPFPLRELQRARQKASDGALLFISCPNADCLPWRMLDAASSNPYWFELEHYHNFTRESLHGLLARCGFRPIHYAVSRRYRCGMEVTAVAS
jgi:SAM-dependent methyltransferase